MPDAFVELHLIDVAGGAASDPNVQVGIRRAGESRHLLSGHGPNPLRLRLPDFTDKSALCCDITPSRYRHRPSNFFFLKEGGTEIQNLEVARLPDHWNAQFARWNDLGPVHEHLKTTLGRSGAVKLKKGPAFSSFEGSGYDDVDETRAIHAKCSLLNLYAKLSEGDEPWFSGITRVLEIDRERAIAEVTPEFASRAKHIWDHIRNFPDYFHSPAGNHYKNIEAHIPAGRSVQKTEMFSIKSREDEGNVQLTLAPVRKMGSAEVMWLLDTDIDENGNFVKHAYDAFFKHRFTGGTHPFDIHECLKKKATLAGRKIDLGYELV
jgi:hypothetical protein